MKKIILKLLLTITIVGILAYLISKNIGFAKLYQVIITFPKGTLFFLLFLSALITFSKAWRFYVLLRQSDIPVSFIKAAKVFWASQTLTPLPGGEAGRGFFLKKELGVSLSRSMGAVIIQAYFELFSAAILMTIFSIFYGTLVLPTLIALIILGLTGLVLTNSCVFTVFHGLSQKLPLVHKLSPRLLTLHKNIGESIWDKKNKRIHKGFLWAFGIALGSHLLGGILFFEIGRYFAISLTLPQSIFVYTTSVVIQGLGSMVPAGLGLTEGGVIALLYYFKATSEKAIPAVVIYRMVSLVFNIVIGAMFILIFYGKSLYGKKS